MRAGAGALGLRIMLAQGYGSLAQITPADLRDAPLVKRRRGIDTLDAALCALGVLERSPQRGSTRQQRVARASPGELVARVEMPERFRAVTALYLETYAQRVSDTHTSLRNKATNLARFWRFIAERYPELGGCGELLPAHARAFVPAAIEQSRAAQRKPDDELRVTAYTWLSDVRVFLTDLCGWAAEPGSPLAAYAPRTLPLTHQDLKGFGFEKARRRQQARMTATVLELERAVPSIRAHAFTAWHEAQQFQVEPEGPSVERCEREAFWDWSVLELLVQSGLRIEEACEVTTFDVLKRQLPDGRLYYLLHVKPSKFDRARVIPIGDGLGRVIADIIAHVRRFYGTAQIPPCDNWDHHERRPLPHAPYLLQGAGHPSVINANQVRARLARLSHGAGARKADGTPLVLRPHDCRRIFASEHLKSSPVSPELARQKPSQGGAPAQPGLYAWWADLDTIGELPLMIAPGSALGLLYVGNAPARAGSSQTLRDRICGKDLRGSPAESPFRRTLCALLWQREHWELTHEAKRMLLTAGAAAGLTAWQAEHLKVSWFVDAAPWTQKPLVAKAMAAPLNLAGDRNHPYSWLLSEARQRLRTAAMGAPAASSAPEG